MSPVSSEGDTSERLVLNNNPVSTNTPGTGTIDRCDGREVTARWNFSEYSFTRKTQAALRTFLLGSDWWLVTGIQPIPVNILLYSQRFWEKKWKDRWWSNLETNLCEPWQQEVVVKKILEILCCCNVGPLSELSLWTFAAVPTSWKALGRWYSCPFLPDAGFVFLMCGM